MEKGILIISSDKSVGITAAFGFARDYKNVHPIYAPGRLSSASRKFLFSSCSIDTDAVIIITDADNVDILFSSICEGVVVEKRGHDEFVINPKIIIVSTVSPDLNGFAIHRRFDIYNILKLGI